MQTIIENILAYISAFDGDPLVLITLLALCAGMLFALYKVVKLVLEHKAIKDK
ncbi:hypothetical protein [Thalassomonas actiniarum]|uniref:Uncharacterized protein n=1 Tax=Thalassomonas actiniarum TaxID=485447 RepID=A0AAF0C6P1_9GAMM|nr:hypothetical protein [Thalassomonas actiniarum]WDE02310.1 hypothetical protein SG35_031665 [Thalassomonas actiniarum]